MKTPEEITAAVLKECGRLCPKGTKEHVQCDGFSLEWIDWGDVMEGGLRLYGVADWMYIEPEMDDRVALHAYRLLNLEAKEIQERAQGLVEMLQETYACIAAIGAAHELDDEHRDFLLHRVDESLNQWKGGGNGL